MCVIQPKKKRKKKKKFILKIKEYKEVLEINNAKANIPPNGQRLKDTWKTVMNGQYANVTSLQNIENKSQQRIFHTHYNDKNLKDRQNQMLVRMQSSMNFYTLPVGA